ncbi:DUF1471 domain-containing protein [Candidatus Sodalis endolongispinus]|uniref:DUF1471 domain-containing protein n=1 Tax=Candidatus Sodalis endolongispinus TaxID=2812662 RepID=A0ABS5Y813_9GAMM|nr:YdgH/BhsA/McbA-like domain containing protein [Candidatus Sodalis endolongispinus]MBT9431140.1 DUF1471 domain-containing protein [Candidatus Sodalis endolongispinus]
MKNIKTLIAAIALGTLSFGSFAAQEVTSTPAGQQRIGVVSATTNSSNLSDLQAQLAAKADAANASSYRIISAGGNDTLSGNAELYK